MRHEKRQHSIRGAAPARPYRISPPLLDFQQPVAQNHRIARRTRRCGRHEHVEPPLNPFGRGLARGLARRLAFVQAGVEGAQVITRDVTAAHEERRTRAPC